MAKQTGNRPPEESRGRRWVPTVAAAATVPAVTGAFLAATAAPASAACSFDQFVTVWDTQTAAGAPCVDVNFRAATEANYYVARMWNGSDAYFDGSQGYIYRDQGTNNLVVAHYNAPAGKTYFVRPANYTDDAKVNVLT